MSQNPARRYQALDDALKTFAELGAGKVGIFDAVEEGWGTLSRSLAGFCREEVNAAQDKRLASLWKRLHDKKVRTGLQRFVQFRYRRTSVLEERPWQLVRGLLGISLAAIYGDRLDPRASKLVNDAIRAVANAGRCRVRRTRPTFQVIADEGGRHFCDTALLRVPELGAAGAACRFILDQVLGGRRDVAARASVPIWAVFDSPKRARLEIELWKDGTGAAFCDPVATAFAGVTGSFDDGSRRACQAARLYVERRVAQHDVPALDLTRFDVVWRVTDWDFKYPLAGGSASGMLALAIARLLLAEHVDADLTVSAEVIDEQGDLRSVQSISGKAGLAFMTDEARSRRVTTFLVHSHDETGARDAVSSEVRGAITGCRNLAELLARADVHHARRWPRVIQRWPPPPTPRFIGRTPVFRAVDAWLAKNQHGHLVLVDEIGWGKSTLLAEIVRRAIAAGDDPIFHFIGNDEGETSRPEGIAASLFEQLCRKHVLDAAERVGDSFAAKLELLLAELSAQGQRETIYLDAADQASLGPHEALLPGALRALPSGMRCLITSRTNLVHWLRPTLPHRVLDLAELADAENDAREYLEARGVALDPPLSPELIAQICAPGARPVFFTMNYCCNRLRDRDGEPAEQALLRGDAALWRAAPPEIIEHEAARVVRLAAQRGISRSKAWRALGLVALVRDPLCQDDLEQLGLWDETIEIVLDLAGHFFARRAVLADSTVPFRFCHQGYASEILGTRAGGGGGRLSRKTRDELRAALAAATRDWQRLTDTAREHALRYGPAYQLDAGDWDELEALLFDWRYLEAKTAAGMLFELADDLRAAISAHAALPKARKRSPLLERLAAALGQDIHFIARHATDYPQGLFQCVWNNGWSHPVECAKSGRMKPVGPRPQENMDAEAFNNWLEQWRLQRASNHPSEAWLRSLRPPLVAGVSAGHHVLSYHIGPVTDVAFSPSGALVATGSRDGTVRLWATVSARLRHTLNCDGDVARILFFPKEPNLATLSANGTVCVWDVESGTLCWSWHMESTPIEEFLLIDGGRKLLGTDSTGGLVIWDAESGAVLDERRLFTPKPFRIEEHWAYGKRPAISPDGSRIAYLVDDLVEIHRVAENNPPQRIGRSGAKLSYVRFLDDDRIVVWSAADKCADVVDLSKPHPSVVLGSTVRASITVAPRGEQLAVVQGQSLVVWSQDSAKGNLKRRKLSKVHGYNPVVCFSEDGALIAATSHNRVLVWRLSNGELVADLAGHKADISTMAFSRQGDQLASAANDGIARVWSLAQSSTSASRDHATVIRAIKISPRRQYLATSAKDESTTIWHARTLQRLVTLKGSGRLEFSSDDALLAIAAFDRAMLWNLDRWKLWRTRQRELMFACCFSPEGKQFAAAFAGKRVRIWNTRNGGRHKILGRKSKSADAMVFSRDGELLATASPSFGVVLWKPATGELIRRLSTDRWPHIEAFAVGHESPVLAAVGLDAVYLWDMSDGAQLHSLYEGDEWFERVALCQHDRRLVAATSNYAYVWDVTTGDLLLQLEGDTDLEALANEPRLLIRSLDTETWIELYGSGRILARLPGALEHMATLEENRRWVGAQGSYLCIVALENDASCSSPERRGE